MRPEYVYVFSAGDRFKIGRSQDPESRLRSLESGSPYDIKLEHVSEGLSRWKAVGAERAAHIILEHYRVRGEWFKADKRTILIWVDAAVIIAKEGNRGRDEVLPALTKFEGWKSIRPDAPQ